ncbi:MAG: OmpH family outer membrane protein [Desulfofustis sp. PB-SRB1]|jgi:outer membrane protein|nr:OmpH family outer membrane protein [Desulfofustis sp. PB-SRB1]MBM1001395.1 OmpH family outer membrane protein [Desulfofustis sp. PB-SRB1]HBH28079.1 OmpH family outer membrane protein [Desulfofustis sp.]HBH30986.1 OmpH family outer membrane protein [Desulfofustis sp.]
MQVKRGLFMYAAVLAACLICVGSPALAQQAKIGIMSVQRVLSESAAGKEARNLMDAKMSELRGQLNAEGQEIVALQEEIEKKSSAWSEEMKQEKRIEFQRRRREFEAKQEDAQFEMKGLQEKELTPMLKALEQVVDSYGKANNYTLILDEQSGVTYFSQAIDITDKLIIELDAAMAGQN